MSRQNAARLERLIAVNTGNLDPQKAADFLNRIREQITNASNEVVKESIFSKDGFFEGEKL